MWRTKHWAIIQLTFANFPKCPNFLRPEDLSSEATCEGFCIYQFVTINHASFHLWSEENMLNHQEFSKYYVHDNLQNFILLFMSLFTDLIVKNSNALYMEGSNVR